MNDYPVYVENLPDDQAQPIRVDPQDPFIAIKQVDNAGPDAAIHWVLVRKDELEGLILRLREAATKLESVILDEDQA